MTMSIMVRKSSSVVVRPSEPMTTGITMKLSSFDKAAMNDPVTSLLVFEQPIHEPAETIKRALSQALVHYYPIAGRIDAAAANDGELHIQCTGEGVPFVSASANSALKQFMFLDVQSPGARAVLDELAIYCEPAGGSNPLMTMQVTEFSCGGFVVGVTWDHVIADGHGMAQFLQAVSEIARGLSQPSVVPVRWDDALPSLPPSLVSSHQLILGLEPLDLACLDITIPSSAINRVRDEYRVHSGGQSTCTFFEVVTAVLWQCRTRAIMSNPQTPAVLSFGVNFRKHVGAKDGYYGNCCSGQTVGATSGKVANGDIMEVIEMIKHAKDQIPQRFVKGDGTVDSNQQQEQATGGTHQFDTYNILGLSSWRNLGFEEPDFGSGNPERVVYHRKPMAWSVPICVTCPPWKGVDGASVFSLCVKKEHADAFLGEIAKFT